MSLVKQHQEWLQLLEVSGPFLAMPVIVKTFPQGLERIDTAIKRELRLAHQEWLDSHSNEDDLRKYHVPWIKYVLKNLLEYPNELIHENDSIPAELTIHLPEHGELLKPDMIIMPPNAAQESKVPRILISVVPAKQKLDRAVSEKTSRWNASPATRMMELLKRSGVRVGIVTNGEHWLLVYAPESDTTTFVGWYASVWMEEPLTLRSFRGLLGAYRFFGVPEADMLESLFVASTQFQHEVTTQLGGQVRRAIEQLIQALDQIDKDSGRALLRDVSEAKLYEAGVSVMMRLVFLLSAEERELFPINNPVYSENYAVLTLREHLEKLASRHGEEVLERRYDAWNRLLATFRAIYAGVRHEDFNLPAYGGSLFDPDKYPFLEGRALDTIWHETNVVPLPVNDRTVLHLLDSLQLLRGTGAKSEARKLSFRALDVEQIGHVYESLLEHTAVRAEDLILGLEGAQGKEPEVPISKLQYESQVSEEGLLKWLHDETGKSPSALSKLLKKQDRYPDYKVRAVCDNMDALYASVKPFVGLVREDSHNTPVIFTPGSVYVTEGSERRSTGTHYTPRSLTEPIVQHALDPMLYTEMAQNVAPSIDTLRSPRELLELKVCDMSCGSGAFLVQACRYLSERILEAWTKCREKFSDVTEIDIYGEVANVQSTKYVVPKDPNDALLLARRLVADRCLYGVDCNPMAVEMAKLSLWLTTLQRDVPFTFLDHTIKCGDSLLGIVDLEQLKHFSLSFRSKGNLNMLLPAMSVMIDLAKQERIKLEQLPLGDICDTQLKERLHTRAEFLTSNTKSVADILVALSLRYSDQGANLNEALLAAGAQLAGTFKQATQSSSPEDLRQYLQQSFPNIFGKTSILGSKSPFHWPLEFPEVFIRDDGGFDVVIGNPPFMGGSKITKNFETSYREFLVTFLAGGDRGNADLCAFFFLRAASLLRKEGAFGLIAINSISEGDTKQIGLDKLVTGGLTIYRAIKSRKWPGSANIETASVWMRKGGWSFRKLLDEREVESIPTLLKYEQTTLGSPVPLVANANSSFEGSKLTGIGFVLEHQQKASLVQGNTASQDVIQPYLTAEDVTTNPTAQATRWAINFFDWPLKRSSPEDWKSASVETRKAWTQSGIAPPEYHLPVAEDYPECLSIVFTKVKPSRDLNKRAVRRDKWWHYGERCPALYRKIASFKRVLVIPRVAKYLIVCWQDSGQVLSDRLTIIAREDESTFGLLTSAVHECWAKHFGSTLRVDFLYTPERCFETFPFPDNIVSTFSTLSHEYDRIRAELCMHFGEGLTKIYNRMHSPTETNVLVQQLRDLQVELDKATVHSYGWDDISLDHVFRETAQGHRFGIDETDKQRILSKLFALNTQRHAQELAAGVGGNLSKRRKKKEEEAAQVEDSDVCLSK